MRYPSELIPATDIRAGDHIVVSHVWQTPDGHMVAGIGKPTSKNNFHLLVQRIVEVTPERYRSRTGRKVGLHIIHVQTHIGVVHFTNRQKVVRSFAPFLLPT